ncbi:MAG: DnaJ domain-containing protein [Gammaproteobacteria bacterium]|nr:DnaJ domain-containing protein [Gammaproteobacteria bacterium]
MDPYHILGIYRNATQDEIKKAYRREAMKWHPDRNQDSEQAKERFHQAAEAYRLLSEGGTEGQSNNQDNSGRYSTSQDSTNNSQDKFADSVFWDVMLDYAIKLAQTGKSESEIAADIGKNGCAEDLSRVIADKAFNIHAHYASGTKKKRKKGPDKTSFKEERLEAELLRAFLGERSFIWSPRDTVDYYLVTFKEFGQSVSLNPLRWISTNKRLMRILNFSIILFALTVAVTFFFPGPSSYKLLPDLVILQLPLLILPMMLIWMIYRRLWIASIVMSVIYLATIEFFNSFMPQALNSDLSSLLLVAGICYSPFVLTALFANYIYYRNAQQMISSARDLFTNHLDQMIWIKNRAGTSGTAAFVFTLIFISSLSYLLPGNWGNVTTVSFQLPFMDAKNDDAELKKVKRRSGEALEFFDIAESHFNSTPPDYLKAEMAYSVAMDNGSLLAAYKLGYMYFMGKGVSRDHTIAFKYFQSATKAPLAFQPHSLELTTKYLAESYNNLGIMYQAGQGTNRDIKQAQNMYRRATEFGSENAHQNIKKVYSIDANAKHEGPVYPDFN